MPNEIRAEDVEIEMSEELLERKIEEANRRNRDPEAEADPTLPGVLPTAERP